MFSFIPVLLVVIGVLAGGTAGVNVGCPVGYTQHGVYCYKVVQVITSQSDAQNLCQKDGANLATVENQEENDYIISMKDAATCKRIWIGLREPEVRPIRLWKWTDKKCDSNFRDWQKSEPNNARGPEHCVEIWTKYWKKEKENATKWNDLKCTRPDVQCGMCKKCAKKPHCEKVNCTCGCERCENGYKLPDCHPDCDCKPWGAWNECSVTCDGGGRNRSRQCNNHKKCKQPLVDTEACGLTDCPGWSQWSSCSQSCGGGIRTRVCGNSQSKVDLVCTGPSNDTCSVSKCPDPPVPPIPVCNNSECAINCTCKPLLVGYTCSCPDENVKICNNSVDMAFVVDGSGSVTPSIFQDIKNFLCDVVEGAINYSKVGLVLFNTTAFTPVKLTKPTYAKPQIQQILYPGGGTRIYLGLRQGVDLLNTGTNRFKVLLLMTDGKFRTKNDPQESLLIAENAKQNGIKIISIGVGDVNGTFLNRVSNNNFLSVLNFTYLTGSIWKEFQNCG